ncbi:MAG: NAD(P)-binding protein [Elusimicrobiaceae bacterium]|nr:NAD(P)-binding protein [Elusimicrobiaceae bacterium]
MASKNLVVGSGISGIVVAERLAGKGKEALIIKQKDHIGGNSYDYFDENSICIHKYGTHILYSI